MRVFDSRGKGSAVAIMVGVDSLDLRFFSLHSVIRGVGVRGFLHGGPGCRLCEIRRTRHQFKGRSLTWSFWVFFGIPIVYFEKNRVFKAGMYLPTKQLLLYCGGFIEYISMG